MECLNKNNAFNKKLGYFYMLGLGYRKKGLNIIFNLGEVVNFLVQRKCVMGRTKWQSDGAAKSGQLDEHRGSPVLQFFNIFFFNSSFAFF